MKESFDFEKKLESKRRELVTKSAKTSSYLTTSEVDVFTSSGLSSQLSTSPLQSLATTSSSLSSSSQPLLLRLQSPTQPFPSPSPPRQPPPRRPLPPPSPPSLPPPRVPENVVPQAPPQRLPRPPQRSTREKVTRLAQKILKALNEGKSDEDDDGVCQEQDYFNVPSDHLSGNVIVIQQKTENHYHYPTCHCNNEQDTKKKRVETSETLDVSVGSTKYGLLYPPQGDNHEKEDEDEFIYMTADDRQKGGEGRTEQTLDVNMSDTSLDKSTSGLSSSSSLSSLTKHELRRRLEGQAGYMEKMVQSCVAGSEVCQDQSSDLVPLRNGAYVPVNLNFFLQPKNVEVNNAKQVTCGKVDVENAEWVGSNNTITYNYAARSSSDDEDENNTEDDNSEGDKEVHIEDDTNDSE